MIASKRERAERYLRSLSNAELLELQVMIDEELSQREAEQEAQQDERMSERGQEAGESKGKAGGYVEAKMINGYGPYAYKRWREGGRLRSEYQGKIVMA